MIGRELELHLAAEAAGANLPALAREFIDARARDCGDALRFSENAWWTCGPVDGGDWTPAMSAYRDALYALMQERANGRMPIDPTAARGRRMPLFEYISKRGD